MATPITLSIPHRLGRLEARRRIEDGFSRMIRELPGGAGKSSQRWEGDRLTFRAAALGQTIAGVVEVFDASVRMEIELPGLLGWLAGGVKRRLEKAGQLLLTKR